MRADGDRNASMDIKTTKTNTSSSSSSSTRKPLRETHIPQVAPGQRANPKGQWLGFFPLIIDEEHAARALPLLQSEIVRMDCLINPKQV
jgi:hypothetical protein